MAPPPTRSFWHEFWPKALVLGAIIVVLWLLERGGIIHRW
jgi:hypothetical protein